MHAERSIEECENVTKISVGIREFDTRHKQDIEILTHGRKLNQYVNRAVPASMEPVFDVSWPEKLDSCCCGLSAALS